MLEHAATLPAQEKTSFKSCLGFFLIKKKKSFTLGMLVLEFLKEQEFT